MTRRSLFGLLLAPLAVKSLQGYSIVTDMTFAGGRSLKAGDRIILGMGGIDMLPKTWVVEGVSDFGVRVYSYGAGIGGSITIPFPLRLTAAMGNVLKVERVR